MSRRKERPLMNRRGLRYGQKELSTMRGYGKGSGGAVKDIHQSEAKKVSLTGDTEETPIEDNNTDNRSNNNDDDATTASTVASRNPDSSRNDPNPDPETASNRFDDNKTNLSSDKSDNTENNESKDFNHGDHPPQVEIRDAESHRAVSRPTTGRVGSGWSRYPAPTSGSGSPNISSNQTALASPDELFGVMSPRRSSSLNDVATLSGLQQGAADGGWSRGGVVSKPSSRTSSRIVRSYSSRQSRASRMFRIGAETPLRSTSKYELINKPGSQARREASLDLLEKLERKTFSNIKNNNNDKNSIKNSSSNNNNNDDNTSSNNQFNSMWSLESNTGHLPTRSILTERNHFTHELGNSRLDKRYLSRLSSMSKGSTYDHGDIVDENLLLSASRIDSTLLRLFSNSDKGDPREGKGGIQWESDLLPYLNYSQSDLISLDAVRWRLQPMDSAHKEALDHELPSLEKTLRPREVIPKLYQEGVITMMDCNQLTRTEGQGDKAMTRLLVKTLQVRGHKAYPTFMRVLAEQGYSKECQALRETDHYIRRGMQRDRLDFERRSQMDLLNTPKPIPMREYPSLDDAMAQYSSAAPPSVFSNPQILLIPWSDVATPLKVDGVNEMDPKIRTARTNEVSSSEQTDTDRTTTVRSRPTSWDQVLDKDDVQNQLRGLSEELQALHDDVTALKSTRLQKADAAANNADTVPPETDPEKKAEGSSSCTIL